MKLLFAAVYLSVTLTAFADIGTPESTAEALVRAAQRGRIPFVNLEILAKSPEQPHSKEGLLTLLKGMDPEKLVFQVMDEKANIRWFQDETNPNKFIVRLLEPKRLDFEVMYVRDESIGCKGYYEITAVLRK